jgi:hypothetical protein
MLIVLCCAVQTSTETFFRTSKFYKAGDEAPPIFLVDGVSYLSVKVNQQQKQQQEQQGVYIKVKKHMYVCGQHAQQLPVQNLR